MISKFRIFALAAMGWAAAVSVQAAVVGFEELATQALNDTAGGTFPFGRPLDLVPGSSQVPGLSFTGATVYHVEQTIASSRAGPRDRNHLGFIQSRSAANVLNDEISIQLVGNVAGGDIASISFDFASPQTKLRLFAYDTDGKSTFFEFGGTDIASFEWTVQPLLSFSSLGVVNRIAFRRTGGGAFALDGLNLTLAGTGGGTVPEPAVLPLLALALATAGITTRRRRV